MVCPLMLACADQAFDIGLHDQLQNSLGNGAKKVTTVLLFQKLGKVHVRLGHRGLHIVVVEVAKLHQTIHLDGHPGLHRRRRSNHTTCSDTNEGRVSQEMAVPSVPAHH